MIDPLAQVKSKDIGEGTTIWQFAVIMEQAKIGDNCNINCHTFIENDVVIGNNVTVKSGVYLWDGIVVENNVFIGPNATFTNDKYPRSKKYPSAFQKTRLEQGCSIGANATILGGITIGRYAIVGAGSVVTKDVPAYALVRGNPAKVVARLDEEGNKLP
jgi:acetyltransferase-like isoleucine patch superfamily enzyme